LQNIILSQKPAISSTISSLPTALLEQLLSELSTLASVYHKPPESFVGKGRFGADEIQRAAIQEQRREAADNPIAASVAAAAANGAGGAQPQSNVENLLDIDFDGAAPASQEQASATATPDRVASPAVGGASTSGGMADMMGLFDVSSPATPAAAPPPMGGGAMGDMMNGFAGMDLSGTSAPPPPGQQLHPQGTGGQQPAQQSSGGGSDDLLGLF
jgi:AP-1 complex subunit beta-1